MSAHHLHIGQKRLLVIVPFSAQEAVRCRWILATAEFEGDLEGVAVQVVEVLHATRDVVPFSTIGDSVMEFPRA